jgi:hypothetical protein
MTKSLMMRKRMWRGIAYNSAFACTSAASTNTTYVMRNAAPVDALHSELSLAELS